jgi:L-amino acid N-acyltransferase YncA
MHELFDASLRVRPATDADVPSITAIYGGYVRTHLATFELDAPGHDEMAARMNAIVTAGLPYLAGEIDGQVVGYCYASPFRPRPAYHFTLETSIYVAPGQLGLGIGRRLLQQLVTACDEAGYRELIAAIGDSSNQRSIRVHRSAGYQHVGTYRNVGFKFDRWVDVVLMQRSLREREPGVAPSSS